jgi:3D (Asp-Asp-Asp) domain-containing protein
MYKPLAVMLIGVATLGGLAKPAAITKADVVGGPMADALAAFSKEKYHVLPTMRITAYASVPEETDDTPFTTASGKTVRDGIVASNLLPFGTKIQIPALFGDKIFTVEDRTSPRFRKTIDIWMTTPAKAIIFGVAHAQIVVLGTSTAQIVAMANKGLSADD